MQNSTSWNHRQIFKLWFWGMMMIVTMLVFYLCDHKSQDSADVWVAVDEVGRPIWKWSTDQTFSSEVVQKNSCLQSWTKQTKKPIGSIIQVGSLVSSHFTPPAVLSSPINLKFSQSYFSHYDDCHLRQSLRIYHKCFIVAKNMELPCFWKSFSQASNQSLLHLLNIHGHLSCMRISKKINENVQISWFMKYLQWEWAKRYEAQRISEYANLLVSLCYKVIGRTLFWHLPDKNIKYVHVICFDKELII